MPNTYDFASKLRNARESCGLSVSELAARANISPQALSTYEPGGSVVRTPSVFAAAKIASALNISLDWLCGLDDEKAPAVNNCWDVANVVLCLANLAENWAGISLSGDTLTVNLPSEISKFLSQYARMSALVADNTIDAEMFDSWLNDRCRQLQSTSINSEPGKVIINVNSKESK